MNKGIMIIGGGMLQIPALKRAKELDFITYLTDGDENCLAKNHADFFYKIDTKDIEGNANLAVELRQAGKIIAVYTQGTDVAYTVAYAAKKAGLPGVDPQAALNCNDKITMREILSKNSIADVIFEKAKTIEELKLAIKKVGFPCYVKPADNCGSRGITRIVDDKDIESVFNRAISSCYYRKEVLIESEIKGPEYSVDTIIYQGKLYPAGISDRVFLQKEKYAVQQIGSRTPSLLPETIQNQMYKVMEGAAKALGVDNSAFKGDLAVDENNEVRIIEVTARTSGGFDSQLRKPLSFGIDIIKATIDIACGYPLDPVDLIPRWVKWSSTIHTLPEPGIISEITGLDEVKKIKGVHEVFISSKVGDRIEPYNHCAKLEDDIIISSADTLESLLLLEKKALDTLIIKTGKI
jgi:biotin carboxylase